MRPREDLDAGHGRRARRADRRGRERRGRREDDVDVAEDLAHALPEPGAEPLRLEVERRGDQGAGAEPVSRQRVEVAGAALEVVEVAVGAFAGRDHHRRSACAVGLGEGDAPTRAERLGGPLDRRQGGGLGEACEVAVGDTDPKAGDAAAEVAGAGLGRTLGADGVGGVRTLDRVERDREITDRARERPDVIEARGEQHDTGARDPAVGRLEPQDAAERRRDADRAVRVGAETQRNEARRDRRRGAARRAAGHARGVVRVARRTVVRVLGREAERILVHVETADQHGAGATQSGDRRRVVFRGRPIAVDPRARQRGDTGHVEQVLHGEGHAGERAGIVAAGDQPIDPLGLGHGDVAQDGGEAVERGVTLADPIERGRDDRAPTCGASGRAARSRSRRRRRRARSRAEDRRGLDVVGQGELRDEMRHGEEAGELLGHRGGAFRLEREPEQRGHPLNVGRRHDVPRAAR